MNKNFDFDTAAAVTEDALNLIEATQELLFPLTDTPNPSHSDFYDLARRARMIDATLRAARDKAQDACALYHKLDAAAATTVA